MPGPWRAACLGHVVSVCAAIVVRALVLVLLLALGVSVGLGLELRQVLNLLGQWLVSVLSVIGDRVHRLGFVNILLVCILAMHHVPERRVLALGRQPANDLTVRVAVRGPARRE